MSADTTIGVLVLGGYLGAGKTSLVNHLLREGTGCRTLVLVNDFGSLAIDEELVAAREGEVVTLTNGCVCCTMSSPLTETLQQIRAMQPAPELIVIETSGVADPLPVAHHAMTPGFRLEGIVTVVDAETVRRRHADSLVGRSIDRQLQAADVLVLNKIDVIDPDRRDALRDWLMATASDKPVLESVRSEVPVALLVGHARGVLLDDDHQVHDATDHVAVAWTSDVPVERGRVREVMESLPAGVVRVKAVLALVDDPEFRWILQRAGRRWTLERGGPWGAEPASSRAVFIALPDAINETDLRASVDQLRS